jgi:hypothetical protein
VGDRQATCRSCGAPIVWVVMESGKRNPIDADSIEQRVVLNGRRTRGAMRATGISHFATCPNANQHRKHELGD